MKLSLMFTSIVILFTSIHSEYTAVLTQIYANPSQPLNTSNFTYADWLIGKGYRTLGEVPNYPAVGGGPLPNSYMVQAEGGVVW